MAPTDRRLRPAEFQGRQRLVVSARSQHKANINVDVRGWGFCSRRHFVEGVHDRQFLM